MDNIINSSAQSEHRDTPKKKVIISEIKPIIDSTAPVRVAFYVRVSTDSEEQLNSFENQKAAVQVVLKQHPEFRLVKIYSDAGISGTLAEKRPGFMEMIADCEADKIDLIYTKSLSRWSRNTLECLQYYRALKEIGVNLIFEKESIDTRNTFTEMALSIYASFAQEESRSISENTKMGLRMRYEMGQDTWSELYGYRKGYVIEETEAEVIRKIFDLYEHNYSAKEITAYLNENGIPSPKNSKWQSTTVLGILKNEKYVGDIIMQKSYVADYLTHRQINNDGTIVPTYTVLDHHKGIVSHEQFDRVQAIRMLHGGGKNGYDQYPFGDKLVCPYCRKRLTQRNIHGGAWGQGQGWGCACRGFLLKSKSIEDVVLDAFMGLDLESIELRLPKLKPSRRTAAEKLLELRKKETVDAVHYFWTEPLIDSIEFGECETKESCFLMIRWKFGLTSTRLIKTRKTPREYAELDKQKGRGKK